MDQSDMQEDSPRHSCGDHFPLEQSCYEILAQIGRGFTADVYIATCIPMNSYVVAIKIIDLEKSSGDFDHVHNEAKVKLLSHPIILKPHCCFATEGRLWVVMPFMSSGSLRSMFASTFPGGLSEPCIATILRGLLIALSYLHSEGHSHGDIKASNIFIDSDGLVKLGDFGFSASFYEPDLSCVSCEPAVGIPYWMAPEVIKSQRGNSLKADIWSFGVTALELAHGRPPLIDFPRPRPLVRRLNPSKRPSPEQLFNHPFFKNCKGPDLLVENVLQGLPSLEERFMELEISQNDEADSSSDQNVYQRRITGWSLNGDTYELDPVFQERGRVTSDDDAGVPVLHLNDAVVPVMDSDRPKTSTLTWVRGSDTLALMASLVAMKTTLDLKEQLLKELMAFTRNHETATAIREEEMRLQIDQLTEELETERQRRYDLEGEVENLTMQLSNLRL
ncbi:UNVERIFIED_CONTAM: Serine/threonine-protein kinase BLUS1 [Sesamum calycinum]|uniref:Serine/threonine-protein kinase BLUS1 n=1 Tax=Sesamum calycinum TaxID=2727403 RepID=A0AAW2R9A5_9LAMI